MSFVIQIICDVIIIFSLFGQSFAVDPVSMHGRSNLNNIEMAYARQVKFATYMLIVHVLNNIKLNV